MYILYLKFAEGPRGGANARLPPPLGCATVTTSKFNTFNKTHVDNKLKNLFKKKFKYYSKYTVTKSLFALNNYHKLKHKIRKLLKRQTQAIEQNFFLKKNKNLFSYVKKMLKYKQSIPFLLQFQSESLTNDYEIAIAFNRYFHSVYSIFSSPTYCSDEPCSFTPFTLKELKLSINKFNNNTSRGPEEVPIYFIKQLDESALQVLVVLCNQFVKYKYVPDLWKTAIVTPIYKNCGPVDDIKSYRPISVTNIFSRIFERMMACRLKIYLDSIDFFSKHQHGFRYGKNTLTNLLETYEFVSSALEKNETVDVIYVYFEKAFDKVDIGILLNKLMFIKTPFYILNWL